jgi:hypothetical protein
MHLLETPFIKSLALGACPETDSGIIAGKTPSVNILDKIHNNYNDFLIPPFYAGKQGEKKAKFKGDREKINLFSLLTRIYQMLRKQNNLKFNKRTSVNARMISKIKNRFPLHLQGVMR